MARDHHVTIHKMPWLLRFTRLSGTANGYCYLPQHDKPSTKKIAYKILIDTRLAEGSRPQLETIIHEFMHASYESVSECHVTESASDLAKILWNLGYRITPCEATDAR